MLLAIMALYWNAAPPTFDPDAHRGTAQLTDLGLAGIFASFAVKLPMWPGAHLAAGRAGRGADAGSDPGRDSPEMGRLGFLRFSLRFSCGLA